MEKEQAKELIGKKFLMTLSNFPEATIFEAEIKQISPSGEFAEIQIEGDRPYWRRLSEKIYFLEELPEKPPRVRMQPSFDSPPPPPPPRSLDSSYTKPTERNSFLSFFKFR